MRTWFVGWDARDDLASRVAIRSMVRHVGGKGVRVVLLKDHELRRAGFYWRSYEVRPNGQKIDVGDGKPFSTDFSFSRFCVPELARAMRIQEPVLFSDPDILLRADINELFDLWDPECAVMCVQHSHQPKEQTKMDGLEQTRYFRKNWSSVMLMHPERCSGLNAFKANNWRGADLHAMLWAEDQKIGALPREWNHLVNYDEPNPNAKLVHFTLGDPMSAGRENDEFSDEWRSYLEVDEQTNLVTELVPNRPAGWKENIAWPRAR